MCLGVPGRVIDTFDDRGTLMGRVDFGGATKTVCLAFTPDIGVGDYAIVHAGAAITVVDEAAAKRSLELFAQMERGGAPDAGTEG